MSEAATPKGAVPRKGRPAPGTIDWEAIELAYRAGVLSVREIGKQYGVSHVAIQKRAKTHDWARDLSAKVRQAVTTQLVTAEVTAERMATERSTVDAAAAAVVTLVREHRRDIASQRTLAETLKAQLEGAIGSRELLEELIEEECAVPEGAPGGVKAQAEARRRQMLKAVSLPGHIAALKDLSTVLKNLIPLERQAFNVDAQPESPSGAGEAVAAASAVTLEGIKAFGERLRKTMEDGE